MADPNKVDPIHQFAITDVFSIGEGGFALTNSALFMVLTVGLIIIYMVGSTARRSVVPSRAQVVSELLYDFVANMVRGAAGSEGMKFFPFVFSLFMFVLIANMFGMIPFFFTVTSHIIVTFALAMLVFVVVIGYGIYRNGFKFFKLFVPAGVPAYVLPIVVPIEIVSFISRPISHSVRLFANVLAGHITVKVFAGFIMSLGSLGVLGFLGASLPLIMTIAITALEFLVAALQAYVFAVLTAMYINDAIHPSH
ncbi:F0F1 ATP synthase subunit A [Devosia ginsengisoli]|uniref:ATP synthase subunit a n=1 Tax=Devosia ginsengisoli TaxID=400770 RepID=A0A5B8LP04_9HYPH|nr:F0F1 ATP synthase subunit A [Devosia ginsengisoli]QDZ09425.1 F0F1 ATP synthase subunit A [Devosia ginsengisoli]